VPGVSAVAGLALVLGCLEFRAHNE
jgi:hypothetical protein